MDKLEEAKHTHKWKWVETELGGPWATAGRRHYECSCGAWKTLDPDGIEIITPSEIEQTQ